MIVVLQRVTQAHVTIEDKTVGQIGKGLMVLVCAERGNRPSFTPAAPPDEGKRLFDIFVQETEKSGLTVQTGKFGAYMRVSLVNDGPVTFTLRN